MSSSIQLAQECLEKNEDEEDTATSSNMEGLEKFAQTIDNSEKHLKRNRIKIDIIILTFSFKSHKSEVYQHRNSFRVSSEGFWRWCRVDH